MSDLPVSGDLRTLLARRPRLACPAPEAAPPPFKPRLTVVETVYYQDPAEGPTAFEAPFSRQLETDEQPCVRRLTVGEAWQALDGLWLTESGQLVIRNDEGLFVGLIPTEAQRAEAARKVVEVGLDGVAVALVRPGESCRFEPAGLASLRVRSRHGAAKVTAAVFPK